MKIERLDSSYYGLAYCDFIECIIDPVIVLGWHKYRNATILFILWEMVVGGSCHNDSFIVISMG